MSWRGWTRWWEVGTVATLIATLACGESSRNGGQGGAAGLGPGGASGSAGNGGAEPNRAGQTNGGRLTGGGASGADAEMGGDPSGGGREATAGAAGSETVGPGAHCAPADPLPVPADCGLDGFAQNLPNPLDLFVDSLGLVQPMTADEPYAISIENGERGVEANIELWGANQECGTAEELLWYGPAADTILCAEFTPSQAFSHVIVVIRPLRYSNDFGVKTVNFHACSAGSCPAGDSGTGRDDQAISAPVGAYDWQDSTFAPGRRGPIGATGYMLAVHDGASGPTTSFAKGIFRLPPNDPWGDGWYCFGPDSTSTELSEDERELTLKNVTRLGACEEQDGDGTASISTTGDGTSSSINSSLDLLPSGTGINSSGDCRGTQRFCSFNYNAPPIFSWLKATVDADLGTTVPATPQLIGNVLLSEWVVYENAGAMPLGVVCGRGGTARDGGSSGTIELELEGLSYLQCPGQPAVSDTFTTIVF